jgi:hypothetical protein
VRLGSTVSGRPEQIQGYFASAFYVRKTRDVRTPLIAGYVLFMALMIGLSQYVERVSAFTVTLMYRRLTTNSASAKGIVVAGAMAGLAFSPAEALLQMIAQLAVPPPLIATASGLGASTRSFGGVIGVAIFNAIFNSKSARRYFCTFTASSGLAQSPKLFPSASLPPSSPPVCPWPMSRPWSKPSPRSTSPAPKLCRARRPPSSAPALPPCRAPLPTPLRTSGMRRSRSSCARVSAL